MERSLKQREDTSAKSGLIAAPETPGERTGTRLLIVDDEKMILKSFSLMMSEFGFFLKTASTGAEALELIGRDRFDIVFLDQHIGKERGLDLMQSMCRIDPHLYFVIITANGNANLAVEALKQGATDFLVKPFFAADIVRSIQFVLRKRDLDNQKNELLQSLEAKVRERTQALESMYVDVLASLAQALEARDFGTYGHCKRVSHYAGLIAEELDFAPEAKRYLEIGALLHDVGKIGINDLILLKPDKLDTDEWKNLKTHPEKGVEILKPLKYLEPALPGILHHHENYDGSGYPNRLKGEEIPLMARIITVADAWDVMRSDRPYRRAKPRNEALHELRIFSGKQFDPVVVEIFLKHMAAAGSL